jgi:hypothetical protein
VILRQEDLMDRQKDMRANPTAAGSGISQQGNPEVVHTRAKPRTSVPLRNPDKHKRLEPERALAIFRHNKEGVRNSEIAQILE